MTSSGESEVTKVTWFNLLGTMKCFLISIGGKKSMSDRSDYSTNTEREVGRLGSAFSSQTDTSTESVGRPAFPSSSQRQSNLKAFKFHELRTATRNFSHSTLLGEGGFGCVYKGMIKSLEDPSLKPDIAVKKLGTRGLQGHKQWVTEVNVLGVVSHPNLVKLVGYCAEDDERGIQRLLVYEYMPNGSVEDHLSAKSETTLPWALRLKIAQEAARGLTYLHEEMDFEIIFRDFKPSNILLDENWSVKLSDFGLARLGPVDGSSHVSTAIVGTLGYAAPEYMQTGRLTSKHDVWSFGVFLYELLTGRPAMDKDRPRSEQKLLDWVKPYLSDAKKFQKILDPRFEGKCPLRSAQKLACVANRCLSTNYKTRPKMSEVLEMLNPIVEAAAETGSCRPLTRVLPSETRTDTKGQKKRRISDSKTGESDGLSRLWTPKLVKTCCF